MHNQTLSYFTNVWCSFYLHSLMPWSSHSTFFSRSYLGTILLEHSFHWHYRIHHLSSQPYSPYKVMSTAHKSLFSHHIAVMSGPCLFITQTFDTELTSFFWLLMHYEDWSTRITYSIVLERVPYKNKTHLYKAFITKALIYVSHITWWMFCDVI